MLSEMLLPVQLLSRAFTVTRPLGTSAHCGSEVLQRSTRGAIHRPEFYSTYQYRIERMRDVCQWLTDPGKVKKTLILLLSVAGVGGMAVLPLAGHR